MSNLPAIELAERSAWKALHALLLEHPSSAKECDDYGMLPLHWACTDPSVTAAVVQTLLDLHPTGARTKNTAGLLPLHIAIKAEIDVPIVDSILQAYPAALEVRTPHGDTPGDLARKLASPQELCDVLHIEYDVPRRMSSILTLNRTKALLQEQLQATHMVAQQPPLKPRDGTEHWPQALALCAEEEQQKILTMLGKVLYAKGDSNAALDVFQQALGDLSHAADESSDEEVVGSSTAQF
ncbi:hypothetical protein DYB32_004834 [Aphanomyces invadans]|uniref:Uncharacterized protein n=1 Tax=Aphanomyces invadans TaxID=157072 RepID=A0A3R6ZQG5_9STRA|nr:hypothetical protein DYB32_004834 [Aphanomyces invadans]